MRNLDCRRDESHAICTCCQLGGFISGSLDSSFAISEKGIVLSYNRICILLSNIDFLGAVNHMEIWK